MLNTNKEHQYRQSLDYKYTHIHVASAVVPGARSVPYPCTASHPSAIFNVINLLSRLREREIDTTNRMRHRQVPFNEVAHTQSHAHVCGSPTPLHQKREIHRQYNPRSCAARRYCGALSSSTRHKYLLGCMILSWTRSASSQGNHIDDSSSSHSPSAEMVVTHR